MQLQEKGLYLLKGVFAFYDLGAGIEREKLGLEIQKGRFERENDRKLLTGFFFFFFFFGGGSKE